MSTRLESKPLLMIAAALALLALFTPSLAASIEVSVVPARVTDLTPFQVVVGLTASCPQATHVEALPGSPPVLEVEIGDSCLFPPLPTLAVAHVEPLHAGSWTVRVFETGGTPVEIPLEIEPAPLDIQVDPPHPRVGDETTAVITGSARCAHLLGGPSSPPDNRVISLPYDDECETLPPGPSPFLLEQPLEVLALGDHVVQAVDPAGRVLASRPFQVWREGSCVPSETVLCLRDGRFQVEAQWQTSGDQGQGMARPETSDSGALWFFDSDNLELLVKVLDACRAPQPRFWVFAAGLTNVGVELRVTDTWTNEVWERESPHGKTFKPVLDTNAFDTCP
jgi:hypothetical protein